MSLRSKLVLSFLLLSVLPLSAIVTYGYVSSRQALRMAAWEESTALAGQLTTRMEAVESNLSDRVRSLSSLPIERLLRADSEEAFARAVTADQAELLMEGVAPFVDSLEFVPEASWTAPEPVESVVAGPTPPSPPAAPAAPSPPAPPSPIKLDLEKLRVLARKAAGLRRLESRVERQGGVGDPAVAEKLDALAAEMSAFGAAVEANIDRDELAEVERAGREVARAAVAQAHAAATAERAGKAKLLREAYECSIQESGRKVGELRAKVEARRVLRAVLAEADRDEGEIPFAVDGEGNLYAATEDEGGRLRQLGVGQADLPHTPPEDWVVVRVDYPESDLAFGIARPLRDSLRELKEAAGRNLGFGLGLVGLALVGVVPLSRRITRDLGELTEGAERLAAGELDVEVPVCSNDEVGRLATTFNRMAKDLERNRRKLVETELQQRLLETENERKSLELEEARRFQLSLLPKDLPEHPGLEVAVFMRTATEVGGDYYDFLTDDAGTLTLAVGDATGHGAKAGTMVTVLKSLFTARAANRPLPEFLSDAAASIRRMDLGRMAMALVLARFDGRRLTVSSAGMPPVLVCRAEGDVEEISLPGLPLGGMAQPSYQHRDTQLERGDLVLLMSDGLPELLDPDGEPFGYARVRKTVAEFCGRRPQSLLDALASAVDEWTDGERPGDDVTFVALEVR